MPGKKIKRHAYLVAVQRKRAAPRVYAVIALSEAAAVAALEAKASRGIAPRVVGGLSRDMVRRLKLKPGEARQI